MAVNRSPDLKKTGPLGVQGAAREDLWFIFQGGSIDADQ